MAAPTDPHTSKGLFPLQATREPLAKLSLFSLRCSLPFSRSCLAPGNEQQRLNKESFAKASPCCHRRSPLSSFCLLWFSKCAEWLGSNSRFFPYVCTFSAPRGRCLLLGTRVKVAWEQTLFNSAGCASK